MIALLRGASGARSATATRTRRSRPAPRSGPGRWRPAGRTAARHAGPQVAQRPFRRPPPGVAATRRYLRCSATSTTPPTSRCAVQHPSRCWPLDRIRRTKGPPDRLTATRVHPEPVGFRPCGHAISSGQRGVVRRIRPRTRTLDPQARRSGHAHPAADRTAFLPMRPGPGRRGASRPTYRRLHSRRGCRRSGQQLDGTVGHKDHPHRGVPRVHERTHHVRRPVLPGDIDRWWSCDALSVLVDSGAHDGHPMRPPKVA